MLIDSHAHVYSNFYSNIETVNKNAKSKNVLKIINCATNYNNFDEIIKLSSLYGFYYVLGIHPEEIDSDFDISKLEKFIKSNLSNEKFIGIGEIGLDFYHRKDNIDDQVKLLNSELSLAEKYNLPVIIHSRNATKETIDILKKYNLKGIIHCFSGSNETAKEYIKLGYKIGIGGLVTFKNCNLKDIIKEIGIENIVLETDCPFMTPEPYRNNKNEPMYISLIAEYISKIFDISIEEVGKTTTNNCNEIFDFNK